jgi:hypothetical protein
MSRSAAWLAAPCLALAALPALAADPTPPVGAGVLTWTADQQKYGYKNMEKLEPAHVVRRGDHVRALPVAARSLDPKWTWQGKAYDVGAYMAEMRTSGVLVLQDGRIVLER